jgi:hypothetical protein
MPDIFASFSPSLESPASHVFQVTPDDTTDLPVASRALNVATDGLVRVTTVGGETASVAVVAGVPFPIRCVRVWQTGTTATGIVALY